MNAALLAFVSVLPAYHLPATPASCAHTSYARKVDARMSSAEEAAKRAWMAKQAPQRHGAMPDAAEQQRTLEEARQRMRDAMGADALKSGRGAAFGFGGEDDEYYGHGQLPRELDPRYQDEVDLVTGKPLSSSMSDSTRGQGFGGATQGWARKPETGPTGPPPVEGTLRAPGQAKLGRPAVPTQAYTYDLTPPRENEAAEGAADAPADLVQQQEDELLRALRESVGEEGA